MFWSWRVPNWLALIHLIVGVGSRAAALMRSRSRQVDASASLTWRRAGRCALNTPQASPSACPRADFAANAWKYEGGDGRRKALGGKSRWKGAAQLNGRKRRREARHAERQSIRRYLRRSIQLSSERDSIKITAAFKFLAVDAVVVMVIQLPVVDKLSAAVLWSVCRPEWATTGSLNGLDGEVGRNLLSGRTERVERGEKRPLFL